MLTIRYLGRRFPRTVSMRGGLSKSFQSDRTEIELDSYDAYVLLKSNSRLTPDTWEFNVVDVKEAKPENVKKPVIQPIPEPPKEEPPKEELKEEKPVVRKKQAMNAGGVDVKKKRKKRRT